MISTRFKLLLTYIGICFTSNSLFISHDSYVNTSHIQECYLIKSDYFNMRSYPLCSQHHLQQLLFIMYCPQGVVNSLGSWIPEQDHKKKQITIGGMCLEIPIFYLTLLIQFINANVNICQWSQLLDTNDDMLAGLLTVGLFTYPVSIRRDQSPFS